MVCLERERGWGFGLIGKYGNYSGGDLVCDAAFSFFTFVDF